jgi:hypothetical protein
MYENYSSNNDLSKCLLDAMVFCNLTPVFSGKIQVKGEKCNILAADIVLLFYVA